jgi:hypothetical protein
MSFLSRVTYSGVTGTDHSYGVIQLLSDKRVPEQTQLIVTVNGIEQAFVVSSPGTGEYTLNKTTKILELGEALVAEDVLVIRRATKRDGLWVVFESNAPLARDDINLVTHQLLFIAQEASENAEINSQFSMSGSLLAAENGAVVMDLSAAFTYDLTSISVQLSAGTADVELQINGTTVTGSAISADDTVQTAASLTANRVPAGAKVELVISDISFAGVESLGFTIRGQLV